MQMADEVRAMEQLAECDTRLKESLITNKLLKVSSAGDLKTRKRGAEPPEATGA